MNLLTAEQARQRVTEGLGVDPGSDAGLEEALRLELLAVRETPEHHLLARVMQRLGLDEGERARVAEALARLERAGDVVAGPGRGIAATLARLVEAGRERYALLGTVGTRQACTLAGDAGLEPGSPRRLSPLKEAAAHAVAESLGGRVISLERWTGLHRIPDAGVWLERLERRLGEARGGELVSLAEQGEVEVFEAGTESSARRPRWKGERRAGSLARVQRAGGEVFGLLTSGEGRAMALPLSRDEATRAAWALLAREGGGGELEVSSTADGLRRVQWPMRLPRAEWRALRLLERACEPAQPASVVVRGEDLEVLVELLSDRLGARLLERDAEPARGALPQDAETR